MEEKNLELTWEQLSKMDVSDERNQRFYHESILVQRVQLAHKIQRLVQSGCKVVIKTDDGIKVYEDVNHGGKF